MSADQQTVTALLEQYERFGVELGLSRIESLLARLGNPERRVPIVHVAGTNGKGSVCAYVAAVLTAAGYRTGRYTSPHLVSWRDRIVINNQPISWPDLHHQLQQVEAAIDPAEPSPTQFEVFTAAMWRYFAEQAVDIAVIEVGLGGRLDATNVCPRPLVGTIVSLSREHWQRLGPTLADIAREKAGILKPGRPVAVGPLPDAARTVVAERAQTLDCPVDWVEPAIALPDGQLQFRQIQYPQVLLGPHQRTNSAVAIAALQSLQSQGWQISTDDIQTGLAQVQWPGRLQWSHWLGQQLLVDGAHNPAAAQALRRYVDESHPGQTVTWLMGMLATKDALEIFEDLLRPGDSLYLVPVAGHLTAQPEGLSAIAAQVCPTLEICKTYPDLAQGLAAVNRSGGSLPVLCGSLYLVGQFMELQRET
ncbi:bifunctional folylpolyglutamate synthase/dihydrofolate synthase [Romeria aff. gracilis LEGE 07310]|uniref:tetrahydrofolate synthase n=1 Tax=Vasconcelosia minhoensis LEGE 07310 TaxID=915328 RepID=A0A8J7DD65_9CYAN|nr:folylpolyglutamate synthase/dihydrofolate synthase family protein [Romeria gracilis]MBE9079582.1 bifunctional folylpolyglutamate synthase/dihydrofolate synthase [Romeria aff. gracilis LEGE 07310]